MPPTSPRGLGSYSVTQVVLELTSKFSCPQIHDDSPASATLVLRSQAGTSTSDYSAAGNQIGLPELLTKWAFGDILRRPPTMYALFLETHSQNVKQ